jgi:hypothetical protein
MKYRPPLLTFVLLASLLVGCSKHSTDAAAVSPKGTDSGNATHFEERQAVVITQSTHDKDAVLPGRHMSENQVAEIVFRELPKSSEFRCEFKDGKWEILEVQKGVWGVSSVTTNADGKVFVTSTNATRVVLRVRDADGKVEQVKTP